MHAIVNLSARLYSSPAAGMASLILSPCSTHCSMDLNSRTERNTEHSVPYPSPVNLPFPEPRSNGNVADGIDLVETPLISALTNLIDLGPPNLTTRGKGFDTSRLPVELICEIFERYIEDDSLHPNYDDSPLPLISHSCRSDPTVLGQICSRWREAAIGLPKLWSRILIYNPKPSQVRLTDVWLGRSGNLPLNLEISFNKGDKNLVNVVSASRILASFITHLESWQKIDFQLPLDLLGPLYAVTLSPQSPLKLESICFAFSDAIRLNHISPDASMDAIWKFFHACPSLHRVVWTTENFPNHAPFQQLTHVRARFSVAVDDILSFLAQVPLIQELWVEYLRLPSKNSATAVSPQLLLQHLRVLRVYSSGVRTCSLFASLTCPSLESLDIKYHHLHCHSGPDFLEIPQLLKRSECRLRNLTLSYLHVSDEELTRCLLSSATKTLTSLDVFTDHISDKIITLLASRSSGGLHEFAPFLEKLDLHPSETTDGLLATMVSSRWHEVLDGNSTSIGYLREAAVFPRKDLGPTDRAFFGTNVLF